ncbi:MAG: hypothetical protein ACR2ML_12940 [Solirubrobacteraceae bacterium]
MAAAPPKPRFCPWCGSAVLYEPQEHEPRHVTLADAARDRGLEPPPLPERVEEMLSGDAHVCGCQECRTVTHVIGHHAPD